MQLPQLKRIRWAVRAALILGVAASVAANVLHAQPNIISQTISAWPPLALLLTVELTSRIPMHRMVLAALRVGATIAIAGIAAWVSYWHMQDVAVRYGETEISAYLLPISVDGLIVVASVSLVELAGRIRQLEEERATRPSGASSAGAPVVAPVHFVEPAPNGQPVAPSGVPVFRTTAPGIAAANGGAHTIVATRTALDDDFDNADLEDADLDEDEALDEEDELVGAGIGRILNGLGVPLSQSAPVSPAVTATMRPTPTYANGSTPKSSVPAVSAPTRTIVTAPTESNAPRQRRPIQETADLADEIEAMNPDISQGELAKRLGISPTRLRAVRREARETRRSSAGARG